MGLSDKLWERRVILEQAEDFRDKTVSVRRVAKVVKGGRRFGFSALVVSGDGKGRVGFGIGKAAEVPDAIRKASERARKSLVQIPLRGSTVPFDVVGKFGPSKVVIKPGAPGTGVIAGTTVRAVMEALGIKDIRTKCIGSANPFNVVQATIDGMLKMKEPEMMARTRGMSVEEIGYVTY